MRSARHNTPTGNRSINPASRSGLGFPAKPAPVTSPARDPRDRSNREQSRRWRPAGVGSDIQAFAQFHRKRFAPAAREPLPRPRFRAAPRTWDARSRHLLRISVVDSRLRTALTTGDFGCSWGRVKFGRRSRDGRLRLRFRRPQHAIALKAEKAPLRVMNRNAPSVWRDGVCFSTGQSISTPLHDLWWRARLRKQDQGQASAKPRRRYAREDLRFSPHYVLETCVTSTIGRRVVFQRKRRHDLPAVRRAAREEHRLRAGFTSVDSIAAVSR